MNRRYHLRRVFAAALASATAVTCAAAIEARASGATRPLETDAAYAAFYIWKNSTVADACAFDDVSLWRAIWASK